MGNLSNVIIKNLICIVKGDRKESNLGPMHFLIFKLTTEPCEHARVRTFKLLCNVPQFLLAIITSLCQLPFLNFRPVPYLAV